MKKKKKIINSLFKIINLRIDVDQPFFKYFFYTTNHITLNLYYIVYTARILQSPPDPAIFHERDQLNCPLI